MTAVLDASAVLCVAFEEPGMDRVEPFLGSASVSTTNWCEALTTMIDRGADPARALEFLQGLGLTVVPFDRAQAEAAARLRAATRSAGLSLGDRACLALASSLGARAITTDRIWAKIADASGVEIEVAR